MSENDENTARALPNQSNTQTESRELPQMSYNDYDTQISGYKNNEIVNNNIINWKTISWKVTISLHSVFLY